MPEFSTIGDNAEVECTPHTGAIATINKPDDQIINSGLEARHVAGKTVVDDHCLITDLQDNDHASDDGEEVQYWMAKRHHRETFIKRKEVCIYPIENESI